MKCRLGSGRISPQAGFEPATRWSEVRTARKPNLRPTTLPLFSYLTRGSYGNAQNVPSIKTEQYSKYIFNTNPLAFFMKLKSLARFDPGTSRLLEMYFTTGLFYKLKYSDCNRRDRVRLGWSIQPLSGPVLWQILNPWECSEVLTRRGRA